MDWWFISPNFQHLTTVNKAITKDVQVLTGETWWQELFAQKFSAICLFLYALTFIVSFHQSGLFALRCINNSRMNLSRIVMQFIHNFMDFLLCWNILLCRNILGQSIVFKKCFIEKLTFEYIYSGFHCIWFETGIMIKGHAYWGYD